jgi:bifunctional polynucleotide phosphatase/kinase
MLTNWKIESNYIFGYNNDLNKINLRDIKIIYIFDLDYTLIKTKSGKKFPINKSDWELLYPNISEKISQLSSSIIGIISNQKGLKTQEQKMDWIDKIKQINQIIKIDFVFASIADDRYRKPLPGSYEFIKEKIVGIDWDGIVKKKKIYYIGDAFGRPNDFSDTDIKYALNNNLKFKTPEMFFEVNKDNGKSGSIEYPNIKYFSELEQTKLFNDLDSIVSKHKKILIITIGLPASGKSFLRKELIKLYPQFTYSNNDDIHDKVQSRMLIKKISTDHDFVIDDNTNLDKSIRDIKLKQFESYYKIGIWFDYDLELCWHLNWMRMYWFGAKLLPKVTYYTLRKNFNSDNLEEGFDKFIIINKVFREMNLDDKIKYYF